MEEVKVQREERMEGRKEKIKLLKDKINIICLTFENFRKERENSLESFIQRQSETIQNMQKLIEEERY